MNEFRLGNLCRDKKTGTLLRVCELNEENDGVGFFVVDRDKYPLPDGWHAEPAPLNEEWLGRLGFESVDEQTFVHNSKTIILAKGEVGFYLSNLGGQPFSMNQQHLHQLQNLYFALTGEELTIKETHDAGQR